MLLGTLDGKPEGRLDGSLEGMLVGTLVGMHVGSPDGVPEGREVGSPDGWLDGELVGRADGEVGTLVGTDDVGTLVGCSISGSWQSYPLEPHRTRTAVLGFAKQLNRQQSPPSHPHCSVLAAPLLHLPLPSTKPGAVHSLVG